MINVTIVNAEYSDHLMAREWLEDRGVRIIGFGGKAMGIKEVQPMPYVVQSLLDGPSDIVGYDYRFTDDLAETAMLFKLTFGGV